MEGSMFFDERNPYRTDDGQPKLKSSVVAFVDILGYKDLTRKAHEDGKSSELLIRLHQTLLNAYHHLDECHEDGEKIFQIDIPPFNKDNYKISTFTDNIVIGYPIRKDAEMELWSIFSKLACFQLEMANQGFFIRGAITIGDVYIDELTVFGEGLINSYAGEAKDAINPRIILTKSAQDKVIKSVEKHYLDGPEASYSFESSHMRDLYKDEDGRFFLNYLSSITIGDYNDQFIELLEMHKIIVKEKFAEYRNQPCFTKYVWSANYHNFFCDQYSEFDECKIDLSELQMQQFSRIYEYPI